MNLLPFDSVQTCPACGQSTKGFTVKYSTEEVVAAGGGRFISIHGIGIAPIPHLEKHCPHCEYGWLEHPATEVK